VLVTAGNSKGQTGTVIRCENDRVLIQGINMCKKHVKRSQQHPKGGIVEMEKPIHVSNVAPCDEQGNKLKVSVRFAKDGEKELAYDKDGKQVAWRSMKRSNKE
jgi:large subunit ribosomal protein L24